MDSVNINDEAFINSEAFQEFMKNNPGHGFLKIRASSASEAVPISGVEIIVSNVIDNKRVIFFEGITDNSGMISGIELPTPSVISDILDVPNAITYDVEAIYNPDGIDRKYKVLMYPNVVVVQYINIIPDIKVSYFGDDLNGR